MRAVSEAAMAGVLAIVLVILLTLAWKFNSWLMGAGNEWTLGAVGIGVFLGVLALNAMFAIWRKL